MIKAILYDLGDIFFEAHHWRKWMWQALVDTGKYKGSFTDFYLLYETYLLPVYQNKKGYWEVYADFLKEFSLKDRNSFMQLSQLHKKFYELERVLYPEVEKTLSYLFNSGILNIIITDNENGEQWIRQNILKRFGINNLINLVVTSKDTGKAKPHPEIFDYGLKSFSLQKQQTIFVAHDKDEIIGANEFGLKTIEYNNYLELETEAKFKIKNFGEILDIIHNYNS